MEEGVVCEMSSMLMVAIGHSFFALMMSVVVALVVAGREGEEQQERDRGQEWARLPLLPLLQWTRTRHHPHHSALGECEVVVVVVVVVHRCFPLLEE